MSELSYVLAAHRKMVASFLQGGAVTYAGQDYPATVGAVDRIQVLRADGGGLSPMLLGQFTVAAEDIGNIEFKRGQRVTVTPKSGMTYTGQVFSTTLHGPLVLVTVNSSEQSA